MLKTTSFIFLILSVILLINTSLIAKQTGLTVKNGVLNLTGHNFETDGNVKLDGEWKFYWEKFVTPNEPENDSNYCFLKVPKNWKGQLFNNTQLPVYGFGTYRIKIIIDDKYKNDLFLLNTKYIPNASKIYCNGKLIGQGGDVSTEIENSQPSLKTTFWEFIPNSDTLDIIIQNSSFHILKGGIYYNLYFGLAKEVNKATSFQTARDFFIIGSIFLMMLYYFIMFIIRKKEKASLFFGLLCFIVAFYSLCLSDLYNEIFGFFGFYANYKLKHISIYMALIFISLYIYHLFTNEFLKSILKLIIIICTSFSLLMIALNVNINAILFSYFRFAGVLIVSYLIYVIIRATLKKQDGAGIFIVGLSLILVTVVNDSLHNVQIISTMDLMPFGMFFFLFLQTYILSSRLNKAFVKTEELTIELTYINKNLEKIVDERTQEVREQKHEIEEKNEELSQLLEEVTSQRDEIEAQRDTVLKQKEHIEIINKEITDSIHYAKRIQAAILPTNEIVSKYYPEHFIVFKPKDIVSGDFYWMTMVENKCIIAVADCTGHGVPGAFMSMLGAAFLNEIINKEYITHTGVILRKLRKEVIRALQQKGEALEQKDGMDMAICSIDLESNMLQFSGANNPLWVIRSPKTQAPNTKPQENEDPSLNLVETCILELKPDKMPIAIYEKMGNFTDQEIPLFAGDMIYMMSDGYEDQFGGPKGKKFLSKKLKQLLIDNCRLNMNEQKQILELTLKNWIGSGEQVDDITLMGIKFTLNQ